jgi:hypothetical protein
MCTNICNHAKLSQYDRWKKKIDQFFKKNKNLKLNITFCIIWIGSKKPAVHRGLDWTIILDFLGFILEKLQSFMG